MFLTLFFGVFLVAAAALAYFFLTNKGKKQVSIHNHDWKPDIVYLYQFPRSASMPNVSPFCLKVETFLKANKIPYEVRPLLMGRSQYGLLPFIELNGEHIADSQIIIHRLTEHFKTKTLLIPRDEAIARTIDRMTDNHTFLVLYQFKVLSTGPNDFFSMMLNELGAPKLIIPILAYFFRRKAANRVAASLGHFSTEDFKMFLKKDYDAYRDLLGDQKFLFGDEINAVDCTVFGTLATTLYYPAATYAKDLLKEEYPTLVAYLDRIRDQVFGEEFEKH
nr:Glutathione S-transferase domain containing protein [Haemonchus contortus]